MTDIIQDAKQLAELKVPPLRAELAVHEDEDPRYADNCLVQIIEKDDENSIWYEEEHGGYEHGKLHFAHVFAAAPEHTQALAEETWEYAVQVKRSESWKYTYESWGNRWQGSYSVQEVRAQRDHPGEETRIIRRRVSEPEVINE